MFFIKPAIMLLFHHFLNSASPNILQHQLNDFQEFSNKLGYLDTNSRLGRDSANGGAAKFVDEDCCFKNALFYLTLYDTGRITSMGLQVDDGMN